MTLRTYMRPDRLIISLPGYDAGPFLADQFKAFDSNWDWTGTLIASGYYADPSAPYNGNASQTQDGSNIVIPISIPFSIREFLIHIANGYVNGRLTADQSLNRNAYISSNYLIVPRSSIGNGIYSRFSGGAIYKVFSV